MIKIGERSKKNNKKIKTDCLQSSLCVGLQSRQVLRAQSQRMGC